MTVLPRVLAAVGALALGLGGALVVAAPASAASLTVSNLSDSGAGSLRQALLDSAAAGPDTISFASGVTGTILLTTVLPDITDDLTIVGPGEAVITIDSPDTVFTIQGGAPNIAVTMSGLTISSAGGTACGINSDNANITLTNVTGSAFACSGVSVTDGFLSATDVTVEDDATGIAFTGTDPAHSLTLTRIHAAGAAFTGVNAVVQGAVATVADVDVDDASIFGMYLATTASGSSTVSGVRADRAGSVGIAVVADDHSTVSISDSSAADSWQGINLQATNSSSLTALRVTSSRSASTGLWLGATDSASLSVQSSTVEDTLDNSGVWVDQIATGAMLTITGSTITGNYSNDDGGGINVNTLSDDGSSFTVSDSTISGNESGDFGGGIYLRQPGFGGPSTAKATIVRTTLDGNIAGGYGGGIAINDPVAETAGLSTVLIDSSTVSNNTTPYGGGGIHIRRSSNGPLALVTIVNTTVSGNDAQQGGGVDTSAAQYGAFGGPGVPYVPGPDLLNTVIRNSTIADNSAHTSAGVAANAGDHTLTISNSILSGGSSNNGNTPNDLDPSPTFTVTYSLVQKPRAGTVIPAGLGNLTGVDPQLAPLANNGGTTMTRLVAPGSPAYNAADPAFAGAGLLDQRGQARVFERLDMGAVEWHPALAHTGVELTPGPPLVAFLLLFSGLAMVAFSRLRTARAVA